MNNLSLQMKLVGCFGIKHAACELFLLFLSYVHLFLKRKICLTKI